MLLEEIKKIRERMRFTYVIPDLHGRSDLLERGFARIAKHSPGSSGTVITIGDYVDKGPDSKGVIDRLMKGLGDGWGLLPLKGNHDAMMVAALHDDSKMDDWLSKGGDTALASYGGDGLAVPSDHVAWLDGLALMHIDTHRVYVHAGVDPNLPLVQQKEETLLWKRYSKEDAGGWGALHVVHGHDNNANGPLLYEGRSNLDTAAWKTGRLVIGVFDDEKPGGPVDFIVVMGAASDR